MSNKPTPKSFRAQKTIGPATDQVEFIITNEEFVDEQATPESFSENERIRILVELTELASHSRGNYELYEGCLQKIFDAIPNVERATILIDFRGELRPVKWIPREQSYHSETYSKKTRDEKKAISWLRKYAKGNISDSLVDVAAAMYAPMIKNGKVIGILHVDSTSLIEGFTKSELDMLSVIASVLALSLKPGAGEKVIPSVFISYSHKDLAFANKIKGDLRRNAISVWIDERIKPGDDAWLKQLAIAIREQRYFLFLMTGDSVSSEYCQWELNTAQSLKKVVIPMMIEQADVPITIKSLQYIDFRENYKDGLIKLVDALKSKT